jgi:hypothetical protein
VAGAIAIAVVFVGVALILLTSSGGQSSDGGSSVGSGSAAGGGPGADPKIRALAIAISRAEGFGVAGAVPTRANNPGDLVDGDVGYGLANAEGVTIYATASDGWNALYNELGKIFSGTSRVYNTGMTFAAFASLWTGGDQASNWAYNVTTILGVTADETLGGWYRS